MEAKLINGKWVAIISDKIETYNELPDVHKKLFSLLLNCELIFAKYGLPPYEKKEIKNNLFDKLKNKFFSWFSFENENFKDEFDFEIYEYNYWKNEKYI